jgi:hypothetical protein
VAINKLDVFVVLGNILIACAAYKIRMHLTHRLILERSEHDCEHRWHDAP